MDKVKKQDITELKALSNPPETVIRIMSAVMVLFGKDNPQDYKTAKRELGSATFYKTLSTFDVDSVSVEAAVNARGYVDGITVDSARKVSAASVSILCWVQDVISQVDTKKGGLSNASVEPGKPS